MEKNEDERPGRLGSTASVRFKPHTEYLLDLKKDELGKSRSDTIRYIVDCYFDKEVQDPELIFASLNDTKQRVQELERRLRGRGTEDEETIELRMKQAVKELEAAPRYKYLVVNDVVDRAVDEVLGILESCKSSL